MASCGAARRARDRARSSALLRAVVLAAIAYVAVRVQHFWQPAFAIFRLPWSTPVRSGTVARAGRRESTVESETQAEAYQFQAEVGKVMDIIINSLYSNKDVFLRELVSNAADACDKKRFLSLTEREELPETLKLRIWSDKERRTLTIEDNGVGMSKAELIKNLGSIARSGTAEFVKALGQGDADLSLIGQFGVGFYSAFLVAEKVEVFSRSLQTSVAERKTWKWTSTSAEGSFQIEDGSAEDLFGQASGTKIVLHLKDDAQEYLESEKLAELLKKYSEFVTFPIELWNEKVTFDQVEDISENNAAGEKPRIQSVPKSVFEWEAMNKMKPIWLRNPEDINQSEYVEFYKTTFKAFDEPLMTVHFRVEGQMEFRALIFIPSRMPFELSRDMFSESGRAMRLYVKRVFINDNNQLDDLIPRWLAFVRGVVDSEDLPLNVGREILQKSRELKLIRKRVVRRVLESIDDLRQKDPEKFEQFFNTYGKYFKVGLIEDLEYKEELKNFVRFFTSASGQNTTSLADYVLRMKEGQSKIYFVTGEGKRAAEIAPAMEKMRQKGYEVLYMIDPLDEICGQSIGDFKGKQLVDINKGGLDIEKSEEEKQELEVSQKEFEAFAGWLANELGDRVQQVQISDRLVDSAAVLVQSEWGMSPMMQRYMKAQTASTGEDAAFAMGLRNHAVLEINTRHPVIRTLKASMESTPQAESTRDMVMMVYETAALTGGYPIEDPGGFAKRVTKLMQSTLGESGTRDESLETGSEPLT